MDRKLNRIKTALVDNGKTNKWLAEQLDKDPATVNQTFRQAMLQETKQKIHSLVDKYEQNRDFYRTSKFNETEVRNLFINPLFEILGWDIRNTSVKKL